MSERRKKILKLLVAAVVCGLVFVCWLMQIRRPQDFMAHLEMAGFGRAWAELAFRRVRAGDSVQNFVAQAPPKSGGKFGRYEWYDYHEGLSFTVFTVIARDGKLISALAGSCTWEFTFFDEKDPNVDLAYQKYWKWRKYLKQLMLDGAVIS